MKRLFLLLALIFSFSFDATATDDVTGNTICKIVDYANKLGGPMITVVIIGASLLAIFGRMPWPALFALGMFIAVFFGAPKIASMLSGGQTCAGEKMDCPAGTKLDTATQKCK